MVDSNHANEGIERVHCSLLSSTWLHDLTSASTSVPLTSTTLSTGRLPMYLISLSPTAQQDGGQHNSVDIIHRRSKSRGLEQAAP